MGLTIRTLIFQLHDLGVTLNLIILNLCLKILTLSLRIITYPPYVMCLKILFNTLTNEKIVK